MSELKPCPFCGCGTGNLYIVTIEQHGFDTVGIFCNGCKQTMILEQNEWEGDNEQSRIRAIEAWNRRADDAPSAQPEERTEKRTETHACDLISRQAAIDVVGIDEEIRCEMCRNPMHTDRGCDGGCTYDEKLYKRIMQILDERIKPLPSAEPEIVRCKECKHYNGEDRDICCPLADYAQSKCGADWFCADGERRTDADHD